MNTNKNLNKEIQVPVSYLKKGAKAQKEIHKAEAQAELQKQDNQYRFWLKEDTEAQITFLDGALLEDGTIDSVVYHEHNMFMNGRWGNNFVCIKEFEPCPLCETAEETSKGKASFVAAFTVIDHRKYEDNAGKKHKDQVRLFVCKLETYKMLQKIATKRKGLAGCTFDVSRTGDKSPNVGNMFDFVSKKSVSLVLKKYKVEALDYEEVIPYRDAEELINLNFGNASDNTDDYDIDDEDDEAEDEDEEL